MADNPLDRRAKVPLKNFLKDFKSDLSDHELRERYDLTARGFVSLIKALVSKNIITPRDLELRKQMAVQRDLAKESQFLSNLFLCPFCSHPHPERFQVCPACGADLSETPSAGPDPFTSTGNHFYVDEQNKTVSTNPEPHITTPTQDSDFTLQEDSIFVICSKDNKESKEASDPFPPTELLAVIEDEEEPEQQPSPPRKSRFARLKSIFSRFQKK